MELQASRATTDIIGDSEMDAKVREWLDWDKNPTTHAEIQELWNEANSDERTSRLKSLFLHRLEFGTAGLRAEMGGGYSRMNDLVVIQTSQGLSKYLDTVDPQIGKRKAVAIGFDGRHHSRRFAELAARVFILNDYRVLLFSEVCPTPFVPYCVTLKSCLIGIMITASHNPKTDNGYKLFWGTGTQIIPPHDKRIQHHILANLEPWTDVWNLSCLVNSNLVEDPLAEVSASYFEILKTNLFSLESNSTLATKITYTPMHGVGYHFMRAAFNIAGFQPFISVKEQQDPHPDFPTVAFPNPEEGKSALTLAMATADENLSPLIFANDPDADRLAVAEKDGASWHIFSGNELGALLGWWTFYSHRQRFPLVPLDELYMLGSTVSTKFLQTMANQEGFNYVETLTGFKWMGSQAHTLIQQGKTVLFAFEEAIGFMCGCSILDKDGISAGIHVAELVAHLDTRGLNLSRKLEELYTRYGYHLSRNSYFLCNDPVKIAALFTRLRCFGGLPNMYPRTLDHGKIKVTGVRDLTTGYDSSQPDHKAVLPSSKSSHMITFRFENGLVATLRTSGTEPKVKYYSELRAEPGNQDIESLTLLLDDMVKALIREYLLPDIYGLQCKDA